MDKSYVSMEQKMCPVCGKVFDSGSILMDTRLRNSFERTTTTGYQLCEEHEKLKGEYIALVVCDESKSRPSGSTMKLEDAYRTGEVIHVRREVAKRIFNVEMSNIDFCFISSDAAERLRKMKEESDAEQK